MTDKEKTEEFVKDSRCSRCFDFGRYDVCHKTCNCFTQDCSYFLAGLKLGRAESENEIAELKEVVSRSGYRIAELKHEIDELKEGERK